MAFLREEKGGVLPPEGAARLKEIQDRYDTRTGAHFLEAMIQEVFPQNIAIISSFGSESAVLLHMTAQIDPSVPVIFLNTGKLFPETLRYRDLLQDRLGLSDVRSIAPNPKDRERLDPKGDLWSRDPDLCCHFRKILPLAPALKGFEASITGRKRFQTHARGAMQQIEASLAKNGEVYFSINPLANWDRDAIASYFARHKLPQHPLVKEGYLSIGCMPCTDRVPKGGSYRDGRWSGTDKEECGIHVPASSAPKTSPR